MNVQIQLVKISNNVARNIDALEAVRFEYTYAVPIARLIHETGSYCKDLSGIWATQDGLMTIFPDFKAEKKSEEEMVEHLINRCMMLAISYCWIL
jgi:hypothetical protein